MLVVKMIDKSTCIGYFCINYFYQIFFMTILDRLKVIKGKLLELKEKDKGMTVFGSGDDMFFHYPGHHYELNPVLTEDQIVAVEMKLGIQLPQEYREFLKVVGDGGAGPEWGLFALGKSYPNDDFLKEYPNFCSMVCSYGDAYANGIKEHHLDKGEADYMEPVEPFGGYIKLSDYGHGMCAYMVVGGDQQIGKIWFLNEEGEAGPRIAPATQNIPGRDWQVSFLDWYENWLDDSLDSVNLQK